ncbi:transport protein [Klebsiella michiganensis]|nr:transport protein [Klebsiella michiganensis]
MTPGELRATWGLGTVFSLRMLGMFMVLPVLTTYGMALQGASEALIGLQLEFTGWPRRYSRYLSGCFLIALAVSR